MRVTLKDIADAVGVSHSTVSRALRDHPRISRKTRIRIQNLANEMGYRPDPALSALAAYRTEKTPRSNYGKIAILTHKSVDKTESGHLSENIDGIRVRADKVGFEAEVFQLEPDEKQQRRVRKTLFNRGIQGVIVLPMPWQPTHFDWGAFAIVGMGENAVPLHLNYVSGVIQPDQSGLLRRVDPAFRPQGSSPAFGRHHHGTQLVPVPNPADRPCVEQHFEPLANAPRPRTGQHLGARRINVSVAVQIPSAQVIKKPLPVIVEAVCFGAFTRPVCKRASRFPQQARTPSEQQHLFSLGAQTPCRRKSRIAPAANRNVEIRVENGWLNHAFLYHIGSLNTISR
ncbi:MAG: LacI family DNA-binding transcriptional regulator [Kiritimatiellia bacterium]